MEKSLIVPFCAVLLALTCAGTQNWLVLVLNKLTLISQQASHRQAHLGWVDAADRAQLTTLYNQVFGTYF